MGSCAIIFGRAWEMEKIGGLGYLVHDSVQWQIPVNMTINEILYFRRGVTAKAGYRILKLLTLED